MRHEAPVPLVSIIRENIATSRQIGRTDQGIKIQAIPFHQYMMDCLYHPHFGYYSSGMVRVGKDGDFYTSSNVGELFGEQLAAYIASVAAERLPPAPTYQVIDWGGGTGRLGRQMLDVWQQAEQTRGRFELAVLDSNPVHRAKAEEELAAYVAGGSARVIEQVRELPDKGRPTIIVANELLDAMPVHRIRWSAGEWQEWGVGWDEQLAAFIPCLMDISGESDLAEWLFVHNPQVQDGQTIEVNLAAEQWIDQLYSLFDQAIVICIDYGDEADELFAPHRMDGTLLCYINHTAHNRPLEQPGEQDLTAHVNFSALRTAAEHAGWHSIWYGTQKRFLVETGLLDKLTSHQIADPFHPLVRRNRAIRQLLLSDQMSELFKVQVLMKRRDEHLR